MTPIIGNPCYSRVTAVLRACERAGSGSGIGTNATPYSATAADEALNMVTTVLDGDHHTFEMFGVPPGSNKEMELTTISYVRKQDGTAH